MSSTLECRYATAPPKLDTGHVTGYASVFNRQSHPLEWGFIETVDQRAFDDTLADVANNVVCRWDHDPRFLLGTSQAGTLKLWTDSTGLGYDVDPPETRSDVLELVRRGDVRGSSFMFSLPEGGDQWSRPLSGLPTRRLLTVNLRDVAPVTTPAYPDSSASVRAIGGAVDSLARQFDASPEEVRALMQRQQLGKLFRRSDPMTTLAQKREYLAGRREKWQVDLDRRHQQLERLRQRGL